MNLYDLPREFVELAAALDESGGEITPEIEVRLTAFEADLNSNARWAVCLIRQLLIEAGGLREEYNRLLLRHTIKVNGADRLKRRLLDALTRMNIPKLDVGIAALSVRLASRPSIAWVGDGPIPRQFVRVKEELDGTRAYEEWKACGELPSGFLVKHSTYLEIR